MATSNSLFLAVRETPPAERAGFTVRVLDAADFRTPVAMVSGYLSLSIGPELSAPGAGSITLDAESPFWAGELLDGQPAIAVLDRIYLWEAWEDGALRFQWLGMVVEERLIGDDDTHAVVVSGPGIAQVLARASVLPQYFPPAKSSLPKGQAAWKQYPLNWPAMRVWLDQFNRAKARGTIAYVTPMFTASTDSGGEPWEVVNSPATTATGFVELEAGTNLLDLLDVQTGQDTSKQDAMRADWYMHPGFKLDVRKTIGTRREKQVIFFEGGLDRVERTRVRDEIANYVVTVDLYGQTSFAKDTASIAKWQQQETLVSQYQNISDAARRQAISNVVLQQRRDEKSQWVIQVPYDGDGRKPFRDYDIGDWIGVARFTTHHVSQVEAYRVLAIVITVPDTGEPVVELTLQSKLDAAQKDLEKKLTSILNSISKGGSTTTINKPSDPVDDIDPNDVTGAGPITLTFFDDPADVPDDAWDVGWSASEGWFGAKGLGGSGGAHVFIQATEPGEAVTGDIWVQAGTTFPAP